VNESERELLLTARRVAPMEPVPLRAGPSSALFVDGDLRTIRYNGVEVVRRIYAAVRDLDWNTLPGKMSNLDIVSDANSFDIRFSQRHVMGDVDFEWSALITGDDHGRLTYQMDGEAHSHFAYAKIGICVHHAVRGFRGQPFTSAAPGGRTTGLLPDVIGPQIHLDDGTDLPLFDPFDQLTLFHEGGGSARFVFDGDLWEMEDQRNWTDASYKSNSTPANLGYVHRARSGQRIDQRVDVFGEGFGEANASTSEAMVIGEPTGVEVPAIGLCVAQPASPLSDVARRILVVLGPAHLRVDVDLGESQNPVIASAIDRANEVGAPLEMALHVPRQPERGLALARFAADIEVNAPNIARVLVFAEGEESTLPETTVDVVNALGSLISAPFISGTNIYFNELNRHRYLTGEAGGLVWSVNPQIHAFDELSLVENLEAQPDTVASARTLWPGASLHVSPVTLRPRFNAVASDDEEDFSVGGLPWNTDPRQTSLFAAAWTLGSGSALVRAGVDSITYFEDVGARGVVEAPRRSYSVEDFPSALDTAFPCAVVLADLCELRGALVLDVASDHDKLAVLALQHGHVTTMLLGNLSRDVTEVRIKSDDFSSPLVRVLDVDSVGGMRKGFEEFVRARSVVTPNDGMLRLTLDAYAYVRVDFES
jgi:D-apionolactonase